MVLSEILQMHISIIQCKLEVLLINIQNLILTYSSADLIKQKKKITWVKPYRPRNKSFHQEDILLYSI